MIYMALNTLSVLTSPIREYTPCYVVIYLCFLACSFALMSNYVTNTSPLLLPHTRLLAGHVVLLSALTYRLFGRIS